MAKRKLLLVLLMASLVLETPGTLGAGQNPLSTDAEENAFERGVFPKAVPQKFLDEEAQEERQSALSAQRKHLDTALLCTASFCFGLLVMSAGAGLVWYIGGYIVHFIRLAAMPPP